ncbi:Transcriptional regulatory protein sin3 [Balamuthia mandrillaris]
MDGVTPAANGAVTRPSANSPLAGQNNDRMREEFNNARTYVSQVKRKFLQQPHIYKEFLNILRDFHSQGTDIAAVISKVVTLFEGHPDLVEGFAQFLPEGYSMPAAEPRDAAMADVAMPDLP